MLIKIDHQLKVSLNLFNCLLIFQLITIGLANLANDEPTTTTTAIIETEYRHLDLFDDDKRDKNVINQSNQQKQIGCPIDDFFSPCECDEG